MAQLTLQSCNPQNGTIQWHTVSDDVVAIKLVYEAFSPKERNLHVNYSFSQFVVMSPADAQILPELVQLRKWASGDEKPPHLLILGYGIWMFNSYFLHDYTVTEALDAQREIHQMVIPLLEQISRKSRVLVLPVSRTKGVPSPKVSLTKGSFTDVLLDWNDMIFLHELKIFRRNQGILESQKLTSLKPRIDIGKKLDSRNDRLSPSADNSGLWFWDSSLLFQLAERNDCEEIYRHMNISGAIYPTPELACFDAIHSGRIVLRDLITILFNLLCNSVLGLSSEYCC
ncbi:hypothetical protein SK128_001865 [Halocaridina rubra]|uniref:Uncharacterized protein n=1 Tax=Halocaridina rubra TaxID=373956 RepID=A0AAN8WRA6_HALRR